uniref:glypican-5-like isoform X1 n=1 Tax=Myxine glutinosa TaxID=7769 RepID=UPI00358E2D23
MAGCRGRTRELGAGPRMVLLLAVAFGAAAGPAHAAGAGRSCQEVRSAFQLRNIGPAAWVPDTPEQGQVLAVCSAGKMSCCSRRTELRYLAAAVRDVREAVRGEALPLRNALSRHSSQIIDAFQVALRQARTLTNQALEEAEPTLVGLTEKPTAELFRDLALHVLGSEKPPPATLARFLDAIFPPLFARLTADAKLQGDSDTKAMAAAAEATDGGFMECLSGARGEVDPFGEATRLAGAHLTWALDITREILISLNRGGELMNLTDSTPLSVSCSHALLRSLYCQHCRGLTLIRPCTGLCLNTMRGCLLGFSEISPHFKSFARALSEAASSLSVPQGIRAALDALPVAIGEGVRLARSDAKRLIKEVSRMCKAPIKSHLHVERTENSTTMPVTSATAEQLTNELSVSFHPARDDPASPSSSVQFPSSPSSALFSFNSSLKPTTSSAGTQETFSLRKSFGDLVLTLRPQQGFFALLPGSLCQSAFSTTIGSAHCWDGDEVVEKYARPVVPSGLKAQRENPEVKIDSLDPKITKVIDKLRYATQVLRARIARHPNHGWGPGDGAAKDWVESSGNCDDEDGCWDTGSGDSLTAASIAPQMLGIDVQMSRDANPTGASPSLVRPRLTMDLVVLLLLWLTLASM